MFHECLTRPNHFQPGAEAGETQISADVAISVAVLIKREASAGLLVIHAALEVEACPSSFSVV
jgi:hypothetical protein